MLFNTKQMKRIINKNSTKSFNIRFVILLEVDVWGLQNQIDIGKLSTSIKTIFAKNHKSFNYNLCNYNIYY